MARFKFEEEETNTGTKLALMTGATRMLGFALLITGFVISLMVIFSAWELYSDPREIEDFAVAIERGSGLDRMLSSARQQGRSQLEAVSEEPAGRTIAQDPGFRFSYFLAWILAVLLLLLIGRLSMAAIKTGGELVLYDTQVKKLARALLEAQKARRD
ncbi:MAG: hypothetical protein AAF384_10110 [Pseudomonadota bacterium]